MAKQEKVADEHTDKEIRAEYIEAHDKEDAHYSQRFNWLLGGSLAGFVGFGFNVQNVLSEESTRGIGMVLCLAISILGIVYALLIKNRMNDANFEKSRIRTKFNEEELKFDRLPEPFGTQIREDGDKFWFQKLGTGNVPYLIISAWVLITVSAISSNWPI